MFYLTWQLCYLKFIVHIKRSKVLKSKINKGNTILLPKRGWLQESHFTYELINSNECGHMSKSQSLRTNVEGLFFFPSFFGKQFLKAIDFTPKNRRTGRIGKAF